jgi:hypothetical protein
MIRVVGVVVAGLLAVAGCSSSSNPATISSTVVTTSVVAAISDAVASTSSEQVPTTTAAVPPATDVILTSSDAPPPFPAVVDGYEPSGSVETQQLRLFSGQLATTLGYGSSVGACARSYWIVRWRSLGGLVKANMTGGIADAGVAASDLPPVEAGERGYVAGSQCSQAVFYTDEPLVDVVVEYQAYTPTVDASTNGTATGTSVPPSIAPESRALQCGGYAAAFDLPLKPCDTAITIGYVQDRLIELGFDVGTDGRGDYGYSTQLAVLKYQADQGLDADGVVGRLTWSALMTGVGLPGTDTNGDGVIFPDELGE